jgi:hypothetical protein
VDVDAVGEGRIGRDDLGMETGQVGRVAELRGADEHVEAVVGRQGDHLARPRASAIPLRLLAGVVELGEVAVSDERLDPVGPVADLDHVAAMAGGIPKIALEEIEVRFERRVEDRAARLRPGAPHERRPVGQVERREIDPRLGVLETIEQLYGGVEGAARARADREHRRLSSNFAGPHRDRLAALVDLRPDVRLGDQSVRLRRPQDHQPAGRRLGVTIAHHGQPRAAPLLHLVDEHLGSRSLDAAGFGPQHDAHTRPISFDPPHVPSESRCRLPGVPEPEPRVATYGSAKAGKTSVARSRSSCMMCSWGMPGK